MAIVLAFLNSLIFTMGISSRIEAQHCADEARCETKGTENNLKPSTTLQVEEE